MRSIVWTHFVIVGLLLLFGGDFAAAEDERGVLLIKKAMKDELARNMADLNLEDLKRPFFIGYTISDAKALSISASLGALIQSEETPYRKHRVRVMVGDYQRNNENFMDMEGGSSSFSLGGGRIPLEDDYAGIRRSLWKETDEQYKDAAETLEAKLSAIEQQNLSEEEKELPDFSKMEPVKKTVDGPLFDFEKAKWEKSARDLSAVFKGYGDIFSSNVSVFLFRADAYYVNSEGTETKYPVAIAAVRATAQTQADDGEPLVDHVLYYALTPSDLPPVDTMKSELKEMADQLVALKSAPVFDDAYTGPVLFEGQAVAEVFAQRLFTNTTGLVAARKPIFGQAQFGMFLSNMMGKSLEDKIGKKVFEKTISVKAVPKLKEYNGTKLIGSYEVDAEGIVPDDELLLVEEGILKTLLNGRTPTEKIGKSNGHQRYVLQFGGLEADIGPGVIEVSSTEGMSKDALKEKLIELAQDEDLDYAIIVRKLESPTAGIEKEFDPSAIMAMASGGGGQQGSVSKPIYVYRVSLEDGSEELVRTAELGGFSMGLFKKIAGVSENPLVYNTIIEKSVGGMGMSMFAIFISSGGPVTLDGMPASFIVPDAMLMEEMDVQQLKRAITKKPPIVNNPVGI